jgi:SOS response regulatory protein OraA/RecX
VAFYDEEYHTAVKLLSKFLKVRDRASCEVRSFFISKGYSEDTAQDLVSKCQERGLINDKRFLERFLSSYLERSYGRLSIEKKLKELGMDEREFQEEMDSVGKEVWLQAGRTFLQKLKPEEHPTRKEIFSYVTRLQTRGFEEGIIYTLCKEHDWSIDFWEQ